MRRREYQTETGRPISEELKKSQANPQFNDVRNDDEITQKSNITDTNPYGLSRASLERVKLIRLVFDLLLLSGEAEDNKRNPYWYGDKFDELYDMEIGKLRITLTVLSKSRGKAYI